MQTPPSDPPQPEVPPEPGVASPERREALRVAVEARDWMAAEGWCRQEMRTQLRALLSRVLRALRR